MMMTVIKGLREALAAEAAALDNLAGIKQRIELAERDKQSALGKRDAAMAAFAAGGPQSAVTRIDVDIRTAEAALMMLAEAVVIAERQASVAGREVEAVLRKELAQRASDATRELAEARAAFDAAVHARAEADRRLSAAHREVALPSTHLRTFFADAIAQAGAAQHG